MSDKKPLSPANQQRHLQGLRRRHGKFVETAHKALGEALKLASEIAYR